MWAPLLGRVALFAALLGLSTCLTGSHVCPHSLDCARAGRHFCEPGSSHCGSCLHPLVENSRGRCVIRRRHAPHPAQYSKVSSYPELDEEIDFLSAVISEQRSESMVMAHPSQDERLKQLSEPSSTPKGSSTKHPTSPSTTPTSSTPLTTTTQTPGLFREPITVPYPSNDHVFIIMSGVLVVAGSLVLVIAGACWIRLQRGERLTQKVDYPAYGVTKAQTFPSFPGDRKLAHSAQMFHYQHQKQQMLSLEKNRDEAKPPESGASTDEENEDGDFTVYECPGLAPTGEMEVRNPLFDDSSLSLQRFHK